MEDVFTIANKNFNSRLIVGTGKYKNFEETANAVKASGADIVTVAVRRVNILDKDQPLLMDYLDPKLITYLPNTAGCYSSEEALRTLRLAREMGDWRLVKLEVLGDKKTLYPDMIETIKSTEILVKEVEISNLMGEIVTTTIVRNGLQQINLANHAKGIYFVKLKSGKKTEQRKIIVQ